MRNKKTVKIPVRSIPKKRIACCMVSEICEAVWERGSDFTPRKDSRAALAEEEEDSKERRRSARSAEEMQTRALTTTPKNRKE